MVLKKMLDFDDFGACCRILKKIMIFDEEDAGF